MVVDAFHRRLLTGAVALGLVTVALSGCTGTSSTDEESTALPESRVGDLGQEDLPVPADLGRGWDYRVDHGNAEDGYLGSGLPATARDPQSVLAAITPLGCRPGTLPMPASALEVTYAKDELPGVGLVLRFDDDQTAGRFFFEHARVLKRCTASKGIDLAIEESNDRLLVTTRTEQLGETPVWTEGVSLKSDEIMLVAVADSAPSGVRAVVSALT